MLRLDTWQAVFVVLVLGVGLALLGYADVRRLLHAALDDRYGRWARFRRQVGQWPEARQRLQWRAEYAVACLFCYGIHDLVRLGTLLMFDLFVVFALLSPFWRYVFFGDWNAAPAVAMAVAGISVYLAWKVWSSLELCRVHGWCQETWRCERCGEYHAESEERVQQKKGVRDAARAKMAPARFSWHGFWQKRLERLENKLSAVSPQPQ